MIALTGTRLPWNDLEVSVVSNSTHHVYSWGYSSGKLTNSHTGFQICLDKKTFGQQQVVRIYSPPQDLQGRGGALRIKTAHVDFCFIVCYFHPCSPSAYTRKVNEALWEWIDGVVSVLPARCVPCLLGDFNAKVGRIRVEGVWQMHSDSNVGPHNAEQQNSSGDRFRDFLHKHYLAATNTFYNAGPTYYGIIAGYTSRVDYIRLPQALLPQISKCCVWHGSGDSLQLVAGPGKRDHRPLQLVFEHRLCFPRVKADTIPSWDTDKLMQGVCLGSRVPQGS